MPRYFFDFLDNGQISLDDTGVDCPDLDCAKSEAIKTLGAFVADGPPAADHATVAIRIRSDAGDLLMTVSLKVDVTTLPMR